MSRNLNQHPTIKHHSRELLLAICAMGLSACVSSAGTQNPQLADGSPPPSWDEIERDDEGNWILFSRSNPGSSLLEFRITGSMKTSPEIARQVARSRIIGQEDIGEGEWKHVLVNTETEIVTHSLASMPFPFYDREMCERFQFTENTSTGAVTIAWTEAWEVAPPSPNNVVRMPITRGAWEFVPQQGASDRIETTYRVVFDPGGNMPHFLVNSMAGDFLIAEFSEVRKESGRRYTQAINNSSASR